MKFPWPLALSLTTILVSAQGPFPANPATGSLAPGLPKNAALRFEVSPAPGLNFAPANGRLFVILSQKPQPEPRQTLGQPGLNQPPVLAVDAPNFSPGRVATLDQTSALFPLLRLADLIPGDYHVQALLDVSTELKLANGPGNLFSISQKIHLDPAQSEPVRLQLSQRVPPETLPPDTELVKFIKIPSKLLGEFHHRPCFLRAGVILPRDYEKERDRKYPLRVQIGGFGARFTAAGNFMAEGSPFRQTWLADDTPRFILLQLDGAGPYGDCYQVNSANNGPCGDALTQELIPFIEEKFRANGQRVLSGGSTGGWVALALQIFYPAFFHGAWAGFPDGVDFRSFQLVNISQDAHAYVNRHGFERPAARDVNGDVRYTMRHECQMENVLGPGDSYTRSGGQWGAWNAVYSPRGPDGFPLPIWDARTGLIHRVAANAWKKYDLRLQLQQNWATLGPQLRGKLRVWVGDADDYFLNNAVHQLDAFLSKASPPADAKITFGPGQGHGWNPRTQRELMEEMAAALKTAGAKP